jgi:hypothetical protein
VGVIGGGGGGGGCVAEVQWADSVCRAATAYLEWLGEQPEMSWSWGHRRGGSEGGELTDSGATAEKTAGVKVCRVGFVRTGPVARSSLQKETS